MLIICHQTDKSWSKSDKKRRKIEITMYFWVLHFCENYENYQKFDEKLDEKWQKSWKMLWDPVFLRFGFAKKSLKFSISC